MPSVEPSKLRHFLWVEERRFGIRGEYAASGLQFPISLRYDRDYAPIRTDPRFQELMRQQEVWAKAQPDPVDL